MNLLCQESNRENCVFTMMQRGLTLGGTKKKRACFVEGSCFHFFAYKGTNTNPLWFFPSVKEAIPLLPALRNEFLHHKIGRFSCWRRQTSLLLPRYILWWGLLMCELQLMALATQRSGKRMIYDEKSIILWPNQESPNEMTCGSCRSKL